jgi:hypothetical protein
MPTWKAALLVISLTCTQVVHGQTPDLDPTRAEALVPTVTFSIAFPESTPQYYSIAIESSGRAAYTSHGLEEPDRQVGDPYMIKFTASDATRRRVFELAQAAKYFEGSFDYSKSRVAQTGTKTLAYADSNRRFQTSYNWSENVAIQELTRIFQGISATLEAGRRLAHLHRYDRLGLDAELKLLEEGERAGRMAELQAITPILQKIRDDALLMRIVRLRAKRLLARVESEAAAGSR